MRRAAADRLAEAESSRDSGWALAILIAVIAALVWINGFGSDLPRDDSDVLVPVEFRN